MKKRILCKNERMRFIVKKFIVQRNKTPESAMVRVRFGTFYSVTRDHTQPIKRSEFNER